MIKYIEFENVGPAPELSIEFSKRMNVLSGDNGLGKSFVLDSSWWALTRTWSGLMLRPHPAPARGTIRYAYSGKITTSALHMSVFDRQRESWKLKQGRPAMGGLVIYAQVDGGFSAWDPARNYWKKESPDRPAAYLFKPEEVWQGNEHCEGLIRDWGSWQREDGEAFSALKRVLEVLSPSSSERLTPGKLAKISLDDPKRYPTLKTPDGREVPVIHTSAGIKRIIALAYLLVWTWNEHLAAARLSGKLPSKEIIFLVDEIEAHLHPRWQRKIVPSLIKVMKALTKSNTRIQIITATHSPLVLASLEPIFEEDQDSLFLLDWKNERVVLEEVPWAKQGDVVNWLVSNIFGLKQGRSIEAEQAIEAAEALMRNDMKALDSGLESKTEIDRALRDVLAGHDPFWPRWIVWCENEGGTRQ